MAGQTIVGGMPTQTVIGSMGNGAFFPGMGGITVMNPSYPQPMMMGNNMGIFLQVKYRSTTANEKLTLRSICGSKFYCTQKS
jgi:hypothetical protein